MSPWLNTISTPVVFHNWWCLTQGINCMVRRYLYLYIIIMRGYPDPFIHSTSFVPTLQFISDFPVFHHFQEFWSFSRHIEDFWSFFSHFQDFSSFFIHFKEFLTLIRIFQALSRLSRHFQALLGFFMLFPDYFRLFQTFYHFQDFSTLLWFLTTLEIFQILFLLFKFFITFFFLLSIFCTAHF